MKLIVGLGNPGSEYAQTRHNAGFMVVDRLAARHGLADTGRQRFQAAFLSGSIANERCTLLKPQTYMNRSGACVQEAVCFYKIDSAADLLVIVDDVALPVGRIRLRAAGSAGGHNGLIDIAEALGCEGFPRLRMGIDTPGKVPQVDYVLGRFTDEQRERFDEAVERACDAITCWISEGIDRAMTLYNAGADSAK